MKTVTWTILVAILFISTFGISVCIVFCTAIVIILIAGISYVYIHNDDYEKQYMLDIHGRCGTNRCYLQKPLNLMKEPKRRYNLDNRLTGSNIVDEELQAILQLIFRDYIFPWYFKITDDEEFLRQLKETINKMIVVIANRVKDVDWIPYLTTQLVDDAASHLRLYKQARTKMEMGNQNDLANRFFDLEVVMEHNSLCRDHICLNTNEERHYIQYVVEALLYHVMRESDFGCKALRVLTREILANAILLPIVSKVSDPDFINQAIIWLCRDFPVSSEVFLIALKTTNNADELCAVRSSVQKEISLLRCNDSGGGNDSWIKSQFNSLLFVDKIIDIRLNRLQEGSDRDSTGLPSSIDYNKLLSENKLVLLSLDFILKNNVALSYFIEYMTSIGYHNYLFAYLNMEGWKISAKRELSNITTDKSSNNSIDKKNHQPIIYQQLTDAAHMIYEQYISEKVSPRLNIDTALIRSLYFRIHTESPSHSWFDDIIQALYNILEIEEKFLYSFRKHVSYVKLLAELELLKEPICKSDDEDVTCADELTGAVYAPKKPLLDYNGSDTGLSVIEDSECVARISSDVSDKLFTLDVNIIETGLVQENGKTFGIYAIAVTQLFSNGRNKSWHVYRRYSDFYELHQKLKDKFVDLGHVPFPGKKTFNNMERNVLEKRMKMLNNYIHILIKICGTKTHAAVQDMLLAFLESGEYDRRVTSGLTAKTLDSLLINPLKLVGNAVKTMPDNLLNTVDGVVEGFSRVFQKPFKSEEEGAMKVGSVLDIESSDNIPLRIMLLLMTEVFDLKTNNQWIRRRIIQLLRQIMHAMFGDIVNRRILDYVAVITSPQRVAKSLTHIRNMIWPNGAKPRESEIRDNEIRMRTRVAAKCALLASFPDELKRILGSETSRTGLMLVFSMLQHDVLNKRLVYVLLEGILVTLFPKTNELFNRLHSTSPRLIASKQRLKSKR